MAIFYGLSAAIAAPECLTVVRDSARLIALQDLRSQRFQVGLEGLRASKKCVFVVTVAAPPPQ